MSLEQRKRVSAEIAKEYRRWRQKKGEPTAAQRKQIVAIGMSKARRNPDRLVARWEVQGGKDWIELLKGAGGRYFYRGVGMGGALPNMMGDGPAIAYMEKGPVSVLRIDRPSVKRVPLVKNNPLDIGTALIGGMAAGATGALVRHALKNPAQPNGKMTKGLHVEYSNVNKAWFVMWNDQVLRILGTKQEAQREMDDLLKKQDSSHGAYTGDLEKCKACRGRLAYTGRRGTRDWFRCDNCGEEYGTESTLQNPRAGGNEKSYQRMKQLLQAEKKKRANLVKYGLPTQAVDQAITMWEAEMKRYSGKFASNPLLQTIMGANPVSGPMDEDAARELELFITSDADLYRQQYTPIIQNLMRKRAKGVFDPAKAVTLFMYLVESGAKKYIQQLGTPGSRIDTVFNKNTRLDVAKTLTESFITEADLGNYDRMMQKNPLVHSLAPRSQRDYSSAYIYPTPPATKLRVSYTRPGHPKNTSYTVPLADSVAVKDVLENPRKFKPNGFVYIDSSDDAILGFWKGSMTDKKAFVTAESLAKKLGRNVHIVASPGFPSWMKQKGAKVSKIFYHMGPYQTITPRGEYIPQGNPLDYDESAAEMMEAGRHRATATIEHSQGHRFAAQMFDGMAEGIAETVARRSPTHKYVAQRFAQNPPCPPFCPNPGHGHPLTGRFAGENPKRGRNIEDDTPILPWIVAEQVLKEAEKLLDRGLSNRLISRLSDYAQQVYQHNSEFAKKIRASGNKGRDYLYAYMRHWLSSFIIETDPSARRILEKSGFSMGRVITNPGHLPARSAGNPKRGGRIEDDTPILPLAVADVVIDEAEGILGREILDKEDMVNFLCLRAEAIYGSNKDFAKRIRGPGDTGRDYLAMFMRHWLSGELVKDDATARVVLERTGFAIGRPPARTNGHLPARRSARKLQWAVVRNGQYLTVRWSPLTNETSCFFTEGAGNARTYDSVAAAENEYSIMCERIPGLEGGKVESFVYGNPLTGGERKKVRGVLGRMARRDPSQLLGAGTVLRSIKGRYAKGLSRYAQREQFKQSPSPTKWDLSRGSSWDSSSRAHPWGAGTGTVHPWGARANPGKKKITMSIAKFAAMLQKKGDPKMIAAFKKKIDGYKKWTHGTMPKTVTLEQRDIPGVQGLWITYGAGKEPESTYVMPGNSKRKGAWKHEWDTMPDIRHDPEAGIIIKKLHGSSKITDFYHK